MNQRLQVLLKNNNLLDQNNSLILSNSNLLLSLLNTEFDSQDYSMELLAKDIEKLKIVLDTSPCTISWINQDLTYGGVNKTLADICQTTSNEFIGKPIGYFSQEKFFYNFSSRLFSMPGVSASEEIIENIDDVERYFWVIGTKFDQNRQAVIIGIDITDIKNLEETVKFKEKLSSLGEMVTGIVHEINNPLALIKLNAQMIPLSIEENNSQKAIAMCNKIDATTDKITQIIRGIKSFVRRGDADPYQTIAIDQIINDAFIICEGKFKDKKVEFIPPPKNSNLKLNCNVTEIFQVFVNLMTNAVDAVEKLDQRWVRILIEETQEQIKIQFIDSGSGLSAAVKKNLFKAFYTTKDSGRGTGIGLSLCKKIIESHGGTIDIDPSALNTNFILIFNK